jgi:hypothetical protein
MSGVRFKARTGEISTGTSLKTILQVVAASNHGVLIEEINISFQGTSNTATPILVNVYRQSTAGTMGSSTSTITKDPDDTDETLQTTVQDGGSGYSAEPTAGAILKTVYVHPQTGWDWQSRIRGEIKIGGGDRLGIVVTAGASVNCVVSVTGEE